MPPRDRLNSRIAESGFSCDTLIAIECTRTPRSRLETLRIAAAQRPDGSWRSNEIQHRPPITQSSFSATAKIIRVLQRYAIPARKQEFVQMIDRARIWLTKAQPVTTEDYAMRLYGLHYGGAQQKDVDQAVGALLSLQRPDGGWAPNPHMQTDAYATGVALTTLAESKCLPVRDSAYERGAAYLLSTQFPDGSWHVRSRSIKFQPYFESGFPFGHDQWIPQRPRLGPHKRSLSAWSLGADFIHREATLDAIR